MIQQEPTIKLTCFETLHKALKLVKLSFRGTFIYAFFISLINQLLTLGFVNTVSLSEDKMSVTSPFLFSFYLLLMFSSILLGNCFILVRQNAVLYHQKIGFKEAYQPILNRLPAIFLSGSAFWILTILGMGIHVLPGILFMTCFYLYLPSLIFAHKRAFESWKYSFSLIKRRFFSTLSLVFISLILLWTPPLIAQLLGKTFSTSDTYFGLEITGMILVTSLLLLLMNAMTLIWFYLLHKSKH